MTATSFKSGLFEVVKGMGVPEGLALSMILPLREAEAQVICEEHKIEKGEYQC